MTRALALMALMSVPLAAGATDSAKPAEHRHYLISMKHEPEDCIRFLEDWEKEHKALLAKAEWGCAGGTHSGWVLVEATSEQAAIAKVPPSNRPGAKAVLVEVMNNPDHLKKMHQQLQQSNALQKSE